MASQADSRSSATERPCSKGCGFLDHESAYPDLPVLPQHLLTTNEPPSDVEATEIRDSMTAAQTRISNLDASMAMLKDILEKLRRTRKDAAEHLRRSSSVLYIRCLPDDVLGEIFSHAAHGTQRRRPGPILEKSPWILGRVCRRWRALSLSHSALWSKIDSGLPGCIRTAQLERSKACGLTVSLKYSDSEAVGSLVDCSSRWEAVDLDIEAPMLPILDRLHGEVPMLRELTYKTHTSLGPCTAFEIAPRLGSATIVGNGLLHLPWLQLKRLRREANVEGLIQLTAARNLVELSLISHFAHNAPRGRKVELLCLRTLYIDDGKYLDFLVLPALEDIYISSGTMYLPSLIDRSSCSLRKLICEDYSVELSFPSILERTPRLLDLRFAPSPGVYRLLPHLTIPPILDANLRPPCPELHSISLCNITLEHHCSSVVEMVESRIDNPMCSPLALFVFNLDRSYTSGPEIAAEERLRARGTDVEWRSHKARQRVNSWKREYM